MSKIHSTALISDKANIHSSVEIGPYAIIEENVEIGEGTTVGAHSIVTGFTTIGKNNKIYNSATIGSPPQDLKYQGEKSFLKIGDDNIFREYVTINPGSHEDASTVIGNNNLFMACTHVAHDCQIANNIILVNNAAIAGHCIVEDYVIIGGLSGIHQFLRLGKHAIIGALSKVTQNVPPFSMTHGNPARLIGVNIVGLKRRGFSQEATSKIKKCFQAVYFSGKLQSDSLDEMESLARDSEEVKYLIDFIRASEKGTVHR